MLNIASLLLQLVFTISLAKKEDPRSKMRLGFIDRNVLPRTLSNVAESVLGSRIHWCTGVKNRCPRFRLIDDITTADQKLHSSYGEGIGYVEER